MSERVEIRAPEEAWEDSEEDAEAILDQWLVEVGASVDAGEQIASVIMAKTNYDVTTPRAGKLAEQLVDSGANLTKDQPVAVIEAD